VSFSRLLERFKDGFSSQSPAGATGQDPLRLATAAVLLEIAHADGVFTPAEDGDVVGFLRNAFNLDEASVRELLKTADEIRAHTIDHFALTNYIRRSASLQERIDIVKTMWRVAYSDGRLTDYENYLVRKLSDLLGIEHRVMIDAKVDVLRERGEAV
jgi:uncharacterized tellurite resistance protein B-like protein